MSLPAGASSALSELAFTISIERAAGTYLQIELLDIAAGDGDGQDLRHDV